MFKESLVMCNGENTTEAPSQARKQAMVSEEFRMYELFFQFDHNFVWKEFLYIHRQNTLSFLIWVITE